jgi:class 3 adenylate cyclase
MDAVVVTRSVDLASPPDRVWPLISDTDRFNRLLGMSTVHYRPIAPVDARGGRNKTSARFTAETRAGGFALTYDELPFEWTRDRVFSVRRQMHGGPVESFTWRVTLEKTHAGERPGAVEGGTHVTVRLAIVPRAWALKPIAWLNAKQFAGRFVDLGTRIDAHIAEGAPSPYVAPRSQVEKGRVEAAVAHMGERGVASPIAQKIGAFVREAADADVVRIRPFALADEWSEDRRAVLRAFLQGVSVGLLEMRWGLVCPSCMTASQQVESLDAISPEGHCQLCDIRFDLDLDQAVEATFLPHPAVRRVPEMLFCMGGPGRTPHVVVQATVDPGATRPLDVPSEPGRYRLFVRGGTTATVEVDAAAPSTVDATMDAKGITPALLRVAPGGALQLTSRYDDGRHVKIERLAFASTAATAHIVSTIDEFRSLFAKDLLKRGTPLKVAHTAILFSDLTGSTALYTKVGDAAAFRLVDDHFDVMREVVHTHEGVLVKTMGDAVMAAFVDVTHAARASADALARFEQFRANAPHGEHIGLKLGVYAGPCYVVTANGALDYFGQTVNVASRVQHLAESGEIILAADTYARLDPQEQRALDIRERFEARVKGVEQPLALVRVGLATPGESPRVKSMRPAALDMPR